MFAMVLAIGLLWMTPSSWCENVERVMEEEACHQKRQRINPWDKFKARWSVSRWCCPAV
ncbi:hypothetical protein ACNKHO_02695 [Shigella flexneri]